MAIRITGMYSGLDTEAIISELVSAQSVKKNKYVKDQTKLSWKMDAWKALNTKIYNFYTNTLDNMRWQASYMKKATKVSNPNAISVIPGSNAVNGVQSVRVAELAKTGKLTGRDLSEDGYSNVTASTKLSALGITGEASFDVTVGGKKTSIKVDGNTKISDVVKKLQNAGLNASFDAENHRFFISSKETGEKANFTITANNQDGLKALESLGLLTKEDMLNDEYAQWAKYKTDTEAYNAVIAKEVNKRAASYKKANDTLAQKNADLEKEIEKLKEDPGYAKDEEGNAVSASELYDKLYGTKAEDSDERTGGLKQTMDQLKADIADAKAQLDNETLTEGDKTILQDKIDQWQEELDKAQTEFDETSKQYSANKAIEDKLAQIQANNKTIDENQQYYNVDLAVDDEGNTVESVWGSDTLEAQVRTEFDKKVDLAAQIVEESQKTEGAFSGMKLATKVNGQDAEIYVDGAKFRSSSNDFNINGMTITVYETTGDNEVTITTSNDVDGIYDMIKNFFTEYNSLINEMSALYNADSSKGYDPLLSEEKAEMADSEIEEWEKKIKDSLLRRDATLGDLTDAIKTVMLQGATVNGKTMYLSDFGINTLGYFNAGDNEKGAYHINGDPDDASVRDEEDLLKKMIASDPDAMSSFFSKLANNLYDKLSDKMRGIKDTSSAFTVYNDKTLQKEYDAYKDKIAKEEEKLNALMDKWYEKFSRMETAMAKLQSKNSGLSGMLGGN